MAICGHCDKDMKKADSCIKVPVEFNDGRVLDPVPYNGTLNEELFERCPDCGVSKGGFHHPNCDVEICPGCGDPILSCDCIAD